MAKEIEVWKDIPKFEGKYQASNFGNIRSTSYEGHEGWINNLKLSKRKDGYLQVQLYEKKYLVHRLVASTFLGEKEQLVINHKDGNKQNNCINNLEWVTSSENTIHAYSNSLKKKYYGKDNWNSKPVYQFDENNHLVDIHESVSRATKDTGIKHISCCCLGKRKTAGGYIWRYEYENNK